MPPVIRLDKLTKRFGSEMALDEVSLEVPPRRGVRPAGRKRGGQDHRHPHHARAGRSRTPATPKCSAAAAPRKGWKSGSASATCPSGPRSTSG